MQPLFSPFGVDAWIAHSEGTNAFLRKCYRDAPNNTLIGSIYQHQKVLGVVCRIILYIPSHESFIDSPQSDPLKSSDTAGKPIGGIFEMYGAFKPIIAGFKQLKISNNSESCQKLLRDCISHKDAMISWFATEKSSLGPDPIPYPNFKSSCADLPATDEVFGPAYQFLSLQSARIHVLYWTALCLIYSMIYQAKTYAMAVAGRTQAMDPNIDQDYMLSWYYADEACRGIPYCLTNTEQIWGAQGVMFSIAQASQIYSNIRWQEKFMWCQKAFTAIEHLGFGLAVCLRETSLKHWSVSKTSRLMPTTTLSLRDGPQRPAPPPAGERWGELSEIIELLDEPQITSSQMS